MSDSAARSAAPFPTELSSSEELLQAILSVSMTAVALFRPIYGSDDKVLEDFSIDYINPAGQKMTGLPEQPRCLVLDRFPHTMQNGTWDFYKRVFETGKADSFEVNYQEDGLDNFFRVAARRSG